MVCGGGISSQYEGNATGRTGDIKVIISIDYNPRINLGVLMEIKNK